MLHAQRDYSLVIEDHTNWQMSLDSQSGIRYPSAPGLYVFEILVANASGASGEKPLLHDKINFEVYGRDLNVSFKSCVNVEEEWNLLEIDIYHDEGIQINSDDLLVVEIPLIGLDAAQHPKGGVGSQS